MLDSAPFAFVLSSMPTPPTDAPALFLVAEVVIRVLPSTVSYLTGSVKDAVLLDS